MSVATVNGHVLFPHRANYGIEPVWERRWQNEIIDSEVGVESRKALRAVPRLSIKWTITSNDISEQNQLADRIMAAKKSGKACAPHWGRGSELAANVTGTAVSMEPTLWPWAIGDYAFFLDDSGNYDALLVSGVGANSLTLSSPVSRTYHSGTYVWPLIFGRFSADSLAALTARNGQTSVSISELTSRSSSGIGAADPPIDGIGGWIIEDTFQVQ